MTLSFWGSQGRLGWIRHGPWAGRLIFAYPDTLPEFWTFIVVPSPYDDRPADHYAKGTAQVQAEFDEWKVEWLPLDKAEAALERSVIGWRPLRGAVDWLPD